MKGQEDWVDGSWSVDCVCGVNYDDGKEMVNCDECGVWVHTWCCGYNNVKGGDDDSFACHKCTTKTKTNESLRVESKGPFRSCNKREMPMEERVHVQGVPGGDLTLFEFPSVFSRQLWKCTGYVPKKFRVKYNEFWDDGDKGDLPGEDTCAAGVLFSMSSSKDSNVALVSTMRLEDHKRTNDKMRKELLGGSEDGVKKKVKVADKERQV